MTDRKPNRFESKGLRIGLVLMALFLCLVGVLGWYVNKALNDEMNRGVERYIVLREPRPFLVTQQKPSDETVRNSQGLEKKPYLFRADENGFIVPSRIHKEPDASVVFLGGSTTECQYMGEEERFPYLVGRLLEKETGLKINAYNSARAGNNSLHCLFILQAKVLPLKPRAVVLMECINDLTMLLSVGSYWSPHFTRAIIEDKDYNFLKMFMLKHVKGYERLKVSGDSEFDKKDPNATLRSVDLMAADLKKNLELFVFICRQHGIKPVLMTQFNRMSRAYVDKYITPEQLKHGKEIFGIDHYVLSDYYARLNDVYRVVAREQNVRLIDLDKLLPKTEENMYDAVHLTAKGSSAVAGIVSEHLLPLFGPQAQ